MFNLVLISMSKMHGGFAAKRGGYTGARSPGLGVPDQSRDTFHKNNYETAFSSLGSLDECSWIVVAGLNPLGTICGPEYGTVSTMSCIFCEKFAWLPFPQKRCSILCHTFSELTAPTVWASEHTARTEDPRHSAFKDMVNAFSNDNVFPKDSLDPRHFTPIPRSERAVKDKNNLQDYGFLPDLGQCCLCGPAPNSTMSMKRLN
ncbi:hypothetical protein NA56DRAFT_705772 [Hyaloscypha hepaticicola]|uniref:Uncharacterized protein n=1 Tax=Hyaloscypha hepaticicola TaxID=2082293 RepID=A0A2J6PZ03_9HELO|nr:hypothetical protein NA56DRAFT_705772 [Hyaloscypha hepaticicola]